MERRPLILTVLGLSLLGQAATAVEFALQFPSLPVPAHWLAEFAVLLGISLTLSIALFFTARDYLRIILLYGRLLVILVASIPEGKLVGIEMTLIAGLILEATTYLAPRRSLWVVASITALAAVSQVSLPVWNTVTEAPTPTQALAYCTYLATLSIVGLCLRRLSDALLSERRRSDALNESILRLTNANVGFQQYATTVSERSTEDERRRISREIHDTVGYTLTNIKMTIEASLDALSQKRLEHLLQLLETMKVQALSGLSEARRSLRSLRSVEVSREGGIRLLHRLIEAFMNATGVAVEASFGNIPYSYGEVIDLVLYRMVQEGMTNAFRHGKATLITINFWQNDDTLNVVIRDNGIGAADYSEGIGLAGMSERIATLSGTLRAQSVADGFQLLATIPVAPGNGKRTL